MFKHLSEFIVKVANLAEAEGRQLRAIVTRMGVGFAMLVAAALLVVMGIGAMALAMYAGLREGMHPGWAGLLTGITTLGVAAGVGAWGVAAMKKDPPEKPD